MFAVRWLLNTSGFQTKENSFRSVLRSGVPGNPPASDGSFPAGGQTVGSPADATDAPTTSFGGVQRKAGVSSSSGDAIPWASIGSYRRDVSGLTLRTCSDCRARFSSGRFSAGLTRRSRPLSAFHRCVQSAQLLGVMDKKVLGQGG